MDNLKTDDSKCWKTLSSEYLFRRPWLTARRDTVELPDGRVNDEFYVLEYPSWINVIAVTADGRYVMVEQYRHGLGQVGIELCAGVVEEGVPRSTRRGASLRRKPDTPAESGNSDA